MRNKTLLFILGLLILIVPEVLRVYLIMPFPGSQERDTIGLAFFLDRYINVFRFVGVLIIAFPVHHYLKYGRTKQKIGAGVFLVLYFVIFYFVNFIAQADKMFLQPKSKILLPAEKNEVAKRNVVLGILLNGDAKAYPVNIIGYHHQIQDTIGAEPVIVTYCTVCRSGRVYKPFVNGHYEKFRLVGMDHFNAMFEDATTGSWWRQENGEAIAGPLKGTYLEEIPSQQMTLEQWISEHPNTKILQPDPQFEPDYATLKNYDYGLVKNALEYTDPNSWSNKSWVIGISTGQGEKAYDWNDLKKLRVINDTIGKIPVVLTMEKDTISFHVFSRTVNDQDLFFEWNDSLKFLLDAATHSLWNSKGECIEGELKGKQLKLMLSAQEYWHSWKQFHPNTTTYQHPR